MAETAITAVLSKFGELAANEAKVLIQVGDDMMLLRDRLEWLQAFIRDADRKRRAGTDGLTCVWVRQTRDVAFEAEDALDEFFYEVDLRSLDYPSWKIWRARLMGFGNQILVRHRLSNQIKRIKSRLNQISENQREYISEHKPLAAFTSSSTAVAAWRDDYNNAVGFDADVRHLEELLLGEAEGPLMFISIVGETGVGKRTLGKVICSKLKGKSRFHHLIRLTVPEECTPHLLFEGVWERIKGQCGEEENADCGQPKESHADKIHHLLGNKTYLLVLGGICSKAMLNCLKESLPDNNNGSRVMLTFDSENEEVACHANTMNREDISSMHQLSRLNKERSGELFRSRAFKKEESYSLQKKFKKKEESDEEGYKSKHDQIVYDITGGYPLAIVVLGGLLRFKERPGQFEAVLQQLRPAPGMEAVHVLQLQPRPEMEAQDGKDCMEYHISPTPTQVDLSSTRTAMERVFWASFEDLPNDLKSCFLYFAAFSKNMALCAVEVVRMWIGEGFIKPQKGKTTEELGHGYLKELVLRCLVDILDMVDDDIRTIKLHPRLHEFLQSEVREAGFVEVHDTTDVFVSPSVRRLSFRSFGSKQVKFTKKLPKLRSFICRVEESEPEQGNKRPFHDLKFLRGSKFLRLFYVNGLRLYVLPHWIGEMTHLRYLCVRCEELKELPPSIKGLLNLQTLDIRGTKVDKIDTGFWKIKTLRHVLAEQLTLPETLEEELEELQTLHGVKPLGKGEWNQQKCPLRKMTKLRSLKLRGIEHLRHGAALVSALKGMCLLVDLSLQGDVIPQCVFIGEGLQYLETVQLDGSMRWPQVSSDVRKDRPNLTQVILKKSNDAELEKMGFVRLGTVPVVYLRSKKQGVSSAANQNSEHKNEASSSAKEQPEDQGEEAEAKPDDQGLQGKMQLYQKNGQLMPRRILRTTTYKDGIASTRLQGQMMHTIPPVPPPMPPVRSRPPVLPPMHPVLPPMPPPPPVPPMCPPPPDQLSYRAF